MVTVAVRPPVAAGVNVTVKAQLADAATGPPARGHGATPEPATAKSPGFEPARAMLVMLREAVPLLVRVTVCTGLVVLRRWSPKARLVGAKVTAGTIPVPASDTNCGLPGAVSVRVTVAVRAPAAVGVNVRLTRQLAPATTVAPFVQVVPAAMAKSPGFKPARAMLVMLRVAVPLLVIFFNDTATTEIYTLSLHDALPISKVTAGTIPVPASDTDRGLPGASSVMVT